MAAARRLLALLGLLALLPAGRTATAQNRRPGSWKVDTFVVLYMENRCALCFLVYRLSIDPAPFGPAPPMRCG